MTNYNMFIAHNNVLNTEMSIGKIEMAVDLGLYNNASELVTFRILKMTGNMVKMVFYRDSPLEDHDPEVIYDTDMNLILGFGMECFRGCESGGYPLLEVFYNDYNGCWFANTQTFIDFYRTCLYARAYQKIRQMGVRCYKDKIMMHITFEDEQEID